ncbi:hypothetical protein O988_05986 [Pseudogymnoascus sp. VKM F-3808]|nr:hypothetical protein O988_05986 [Pseudogymnoascus sp. VKM F-3808]
MSYDLPGVWDRDNLIDNQVMAILGPAFYRLKVDVQRALACHLIEMRQASKLSQTSVLVENCLNSPVSESGLDRLQKRSGPVLSSPVVMVRAGQPMGAL